MRSVRPSDLARIVPDLQFAESGESAAARSDFWTRVLLGVPFLGAFVIQLRGSESRSTAAVIVVVAALFFTVLALVLKAGVRRKTFGKSMSEDHFRIMAWVEVDRTTRPRGYVVGEGRVSLMADGGRVAVDPSTITLLTSKSQKRVVGLKVDGESRSWRARVLRV